MQSSAGAQPPGPGEKKEKEGLALPLRLLEKRLVRLEGDCAACQEQMSRSLPLHLAGRLEKLEEHTVDWENKLVVLRQELAPSSCLPLFTPRR